MFEAIARNLPERTANNIGGSDLIKWYVGIQDPEDLPKYMDLIGSAYEVN